jgi:hypothetical protein
MTQRPPNCGRLHSTTFINMHAAVCLQPCDAGPSHAEVYLRAKATPALLPHPPPVAIAWASAWAVGAALSHLQHSAEVSCTGSSRSTPAMLARESALPATAWLTAGPPTAWETAVACELPAARASLNACPFRASDTACASELPMA